MDMLESIRYILINTRGQVWDDKDDFDTTMGVKWGCPMSPLLFSLYFDRVINYLQQYIPASKAIQIANLVGRAALYANDVIKIGRASCRERV